MPRQRAVTLPRLTVEDLDRDELLFLAKRSLLGPRELWLARCEILADRAAIAFRARDAADSAWARAAVELLGSGARGAEWTRRNAEVDRLERIKQHAAAKYRRAENKAQAAHAAFMACP
ncbi:hypothetical protein [Methylobacterium gnaphalii]|uniref:Uncharacterized protein n=1 Tax=Methylobacterium gnaphalii TaxID=1010610 RepID=A0A512JPA7_9HYPH|nr:hypothetical protein [Methylobacterium gnaphalii]GEP11778.1 hypothetical protein MGN01_36230 [Methylobacterium gnaphalii]GJD69455.1 hypothetical protein MMMDOFMJ_2386 [Methylobacterium gnaphalii]GLS49587.1 hypothetical protein GCM10007885_24360 [Methylobacterium gnaphalii]